jgi:hypothetical protein
LHDINPPAQLPTYFGNAIFYPSTRETSTTFGKDYSWSQGLGIEYYSVKTRSSPKKIQSMTTLPTITDPSSLDSGVLRVVEQ